MSWHEFASQAPSLAAYGRARLGAGVAYLATVRKSGSPRLHPVTPVLGESLFLFMEPTSPKGHDLRRGSGYVLHCGVEDTGGGAGEFLVEGRARPWKILPREPSPRQRPAIRRQRVISCSSWMSTPSSVQSMRSRARSDSGGIDDSTGTSVQLTDLAGNRPNGIPDSARGSGVIVTGLHCRR